ncbi:ankyrin repeats (3 copies) domain-containing protein [Ditylenchus destructor]|uniref:Ankyrin repeats (3 copies) domain-containing protein n=1 Tax=Ditylenchus destructor TaxID=166010 RepID=A0AAD4MQ45_9BILA|nr:ankyrin repeats (3 copies) domain-containing protein [Ditylenchus destructor]
MPSCFKPWILLVWVIAMQEYVMTNKLEKLFKIISAPNSNNRVVNAFLDGEGKGVAINDKKDGQTALHAAVLEDNAGVVECLLQHNADKEGLDNHLWTPLMAAVLYKREKSLEVLLKYKAKTDMSYPTSGDAILSTAVSNGYTNIVKSLLNHGMDPKNVKSTTGLPMVHLAAMKGHVGTVEALLEHEAKSNKGRQTTSISEIANNMNAIQWAVDHGNVAVMRVLMKYDRDAENKIKNDLLYEDGSTLLLEAAQSGQLEVVKALVEEYGANVELKGDKNWNNTPLHFAREFARRDTAKYLEKKIKEKQ